MLLSSAKNRFNVSHLFFVYLMRKTEEEHFPTTNTVHFVILTISPKLKWGKKQKSLVKCSFQIKHKWPQMKLTAYEGKYTLPSIFLTTTGAQNESWDTDVTNPISPQCRDMGTTVLTRGLIVQTTEISCPLLWLQKGEGKLKLMN